MWHFTVHSVTPTFLLVLDNNERDDTSTTVRKEMYTKKNFHDTLDGHDVIFMFLCVYLKY